MTVSRLVALFAGLLLALPVAAQGPPVVLTERVVDQADLLTPSVERVLSDLLRAHEEATTNQVVVLTVASLHGEPIEAFALRVAEGAGLGTAGGDNGVLLVVAVKERGVRIEVGYGLEGALPDAVAGRIIRDGIVPHFRAGDFEQGIQAGVAAVLNRLEAASSDGEAVSGTPAYAAPSPVFRPGLDRFTLVLAAFYAALLVLGLVAAALNVLNEVPKRIIFFLVLTPVFYVSIRSLCVLLLSPFVPLDLWRFGGVFGVVIYAAAFWGLVYYFFGMDERMGAWRRYFSPLASAGKKGVAAGKPYRARVRLLALAAVTVMVGSGIYLGWVPWLWMGAGLLLVVGVYVRLAPPGAFAAGGSSSGSSYRSSGGSSGYSSSRSSSSSYSSSSSSSSSFSSSSSSSSFSGGGGSFGGGGASGSW